MREPIRVLHVEAGSTEVTTTNLKREDDRISVETEQSYLGALCRHEAEKFDCILSEYDLPDQNGIDLLRAIRTEYPDLPFILFTDNGDEGIASEAISAGVTDYLRKDETEHYELLADRIVNSAEEYRSQRFEKRTKQRPEQILERISDAFIALDNEWRFTYANEAAEEVFEKPLEDLLGECIWEQYPEAKHTPFYDQYREATEQLEPRAFEAYFEPWGRWYREHLYPTEDGLSVIFRDITDEKEREQERERHRERMELTLEKTGSIIFEVNLETGYVSRQGQYDQFFNIQPKQIDTWRAFADRVIHPADRDRFRRLFEEFEGGQREDATIEYRTNRDVADVEWIRGELFAIDGNDREPRRVIGLAQDVTERKRYENRLRDERQFVKSIFESLPDSLYVFDTDGYLLRWNEQLETTTGYSADEIEEMYVTDFVPESEVEMIEERFREVLTEKRSVAVESAFETKAGSEVPFEFTGGPLEDVDGNIRGLTGIGRDITERKERERQLQRERDRFENLVASVTEYAICMLDREGHVATWNAGAERIKGYSEGEVLGESYAVFYSDAAVSDGKPKRLLAQAAEEGGAADEGWRVRKDGSRFWANDTITPLYEDGELYGFTKVTRDMTDRKRREDRLSGLNDALAEVMNVESIQSACNIVVETARTELDLPVTLIALFDDEQGSLRPVARTPAAQKQLDAARLLRQEGAAWQTFTSGESDIFERDVLSAETITTDDWTDWLAVCPLGRHGVFVTTVQSTTDVDIETDFVEMVSDYLRNALDRLEREKLLRERKAELKSRNERLDRINRINDIIRSIDRELVSATNRDELERSVCRKLANSESYRFAWIGTYNSQRDRIEPRARAGVENGYLDGISLEIDGDSNAKTPTAEAIRTKEPQIVENVRTEPPYEPWREAALRQGFRSIIAVPIVYRDRLYCALTIYANSPAFVDKLEQEVLTELGNNIAHAINAIETRHALVSDTIVELDLNVPISAIPFVDALDVQSGCEIDLETISPVREGTYRVIFTTQRVETSEPMAAMDESPNMREPTLITDTGELSRYKCLIGGDHLVAWLLGKGSIPRSLAVNEHDVRITVHLPQRDDIREFVGLLQDRYDGSELKAVREREPTGETIQVFRSELEERLTQRQREVLQLAYTGGYFESPRERTASELADLLDITQPTFTKHLRTCQRKLFDVLYENENS